MAAAFGHERKPSKGTKDWWIPNITFITNRGSGPRLTRHRSAFGHKRKHFKGTKDWWIPNITFIITRGAGPRLTRHRSAFGHKRKHFKGTKDWWIPNITFIINRGAGPRLTRHRLQSNEANCIHLHARLMRLIRSMLLYVHRDHIRTVEDRV